MPKAREFNSHISCYGIYQFQVKVGFLLVINGHMKIVLTNISEVVSLAVTFSFSVF